MNQQQSHDAREGGRSPRYTSLADYVRVIQRRRWIVVALTVAGIALGAVAVLTRDDTYTAAASLSYRDVTQELVLLGIDTSPEQAPQTRAAINAELITGALITDAVAERLDELDADQLTQAVSARVGTQTQFVVINATAASPELAARIANAYADEARKLGNRRTERRLGKVEKSVLGELRKVRRKDEPTSGFRRSVLESRLTTVQTLQDTARTVELAQRASPPSGPDGLGLSASLVLGGLLGLILGLAAAFGRDVLDGTVHTAHEVHVELGLPVVGRVRESAFGHPGLARNGSEPMWDSDFEAFRVLRTNLRYLEQQNGGGPLRSLLVTSARPEEGKSTVSMALASAAAVAGARVLLVEGDLRRPCFTRRLGMPPSPGLAGYLRGTASPQEVVQTVELTGPRLVAPQSDAAAQGGTTVNARFACIAAGGMPADSAELLASSRFGEFMGTVRRAYDLVIVDSPPILAVGDPLELIEHVDAVLFCVRAHASTRMDVRAARSVLANVPERPSSAVVTGLRLSGPDSYDYYYGY